MMPSPSRSAIAALALACLAATATAQTVPTPAPPDSLVLRLAAMSAVTGFEDAMAESLLATLPGATVDRAGNIVLTRGSGDPVRLAFCPMDEVGYVVGAVTAEGYLTLRRVGATPMGPLYDQFLEGQRVTLFGRNGAVPGVVGVRSTHLTRGRPAAGEEPFALDNAYVDVGASSEAGVRALGLDVLAPVTRAKRPHRYGPDLVAAPDAAARAGCAALLAALQRDPAPGVHGTVVAAFTRRRHLRWDGAAFLLMERGRGAAASDVVMLGQAGSADSLGTGAAPAGRDSVPAAQGFQAVTAWRLPARYARTPVETVSLKDVAALADRLHWFLGGAR
jgi:putative aminopeptidase FrvX